MKNRVSEYIRLDYNETQIVKTDLNFESNLSIQDATSNDNPVPLGQLHTLTGTMKTEIVQSLPTTVQPLSKLSFRLEGFNTRNATSGEVVASLNAYPGIGGITFCTKSGDILTPVGWSWGAAEFDAVSVYNNFRANIVGNHKLYYAVMPYENRQISAQRRLMFNPTQDDKDYLTALGYPIICVHMNGEKNYHFSASDNYYDWSNPIFAFKPYGQRFLYSSGQRNISMLTSNSSVATNYLDFWIESDDFDSLTNFTYNVIGLTFGSGFSSGSNYGCPGYKLTMHKNRYKEMDVNVEMGGGRLYCYANISEDEQYNDFEFSDAFLATYGSTANINYLQLGFKARIKYNNTSKDYTVEVN